MAGSGSSVPPGAHAGERDVLLATKFHPPRPRPDLLVRQRLIDQLDRAAGEAILVSAPAGFGKTTVLADWARGHGRAVAWLALDADDNDPARFWRYLVTAVDRVHAGIADRVVPMLDAPERPTAEAVVTVLVNELTAGRGEFWLVLDDYQLIESRPVHDSVAFLLEHLPSRSHVVIASRSDPPLPLPRLRARGQLAELRAPDLRFTVEETGVVLREVWGLDLPDDSVAALEARTEGWPSGVQLAALSLRGAADPARLVEQFTGSHRYVLDYLTEEVLERQSDHVQTFLLETSILERLTGPLCDAVTGRRDGQQMLRHLESANLFIFPLDSDRRWYRYHQLFADLLRARLHPADPDRVPELHSRAAAWAEEHGLIEDAVRHSLAAGDDGRAARLVEWYVVEVFQRGEGATLRRWLSALPPPVVAAHPRLCLVQAIAAASAGALPAAARLLEDAERALAAAAEAPAEAPPGWAEGALANVPAAIALLRASLSIHRGDAESAIGLVRQTQEHLTDDDQGARLSGRWNLALADWTRGRLTDAERAFADIAAQGRAAGQRHLAVNAGCVLGQVQQAQGRIRAALHTFRQGLELATNADPPVLTGGMAHVGIAQVFYQRDRLDDALRHAAEGMALCRQLTSTRALASALVTLAWIRQASGDTTGARTAIDEAVQVFADPQSIALHNPAPAERARLLLALGDVAEAASWIEEQDLPDTATPTYAREREYLVLARLWLARNVPEHALDLLGRLRREAETQDRTASVIEIGALQALALDQAGRSTQALTALLEVLAVAHPEGHVRVFADEGPPMADLLRKVTVVGTRGAPARLPGAIPVDYLSRLLRAFRQHQRNPTQDLNRGLRAVVLTPRELEVLVLLETGKSNREIAEELVVTVDTVKKHVTHILDKLDAANRTQAAARARELALIR